MLERCTGLAIRFNETSCAEQYQPSHPRRMIDGQAAGNPVSERVTDDVCCAIRARGDRLRGVPCEVVQGDAVGRAGFCPGMGYA